MTSGKEETWEGNRAQDDAGRDESEAQRLDRNLSELLQELRVAGLGVQVLFGFLLSLPFTNRFPRLSSTQEAVYLTALFLAATATALLVAPVAYHRILFHRHDKRGLIQLANVTALVGLAAVALAITAAVLLDMSVVERGAVVPAAVASIFAVFAALWLILPLARRSLPDR